MRKTLGLGMGAIILLVMIGIYAVLFFNKGQSVTLSDVPIQTLQIDVSNADIFIDKTTSDTVEVRATETRTAKFDIREKANNVLSIKQKTTGFLSWLSFGSKPEVHISLPATQYNKLQINASSGDITVKNMTVTSVQIETSSGDIEASDLTAESYDLNATSGDMELAQLGSIAKEASFRSSSGELSIETLTTDTLLTESTSGDVSLEAITFGQGKSAVTTSSGDIDIAPIFSEETALSIHSSSGDQTLTSKNDNQFSFTIRTTSGDINVPSNYTLTTEKDNEVIGSTATNATNTLTMEASSGDVKIKN